TTSIVIHRSTLSPYPTLFRSELLPSKKSSPNSEEIMGRIPIFLTARVAILIAALSINPDAFGQTAAKPETVIQAGSEVSFDYTRSEEHTSELQSRVDLVCRLL